MLNPVAKLIVPTPGTPVRVTSQETDPSLVYHVHGVLIQALKGNTGCIYIGTSDMNGAAQTKLHATLPIPTANSIPAFAAALTLAPNAIQLRDLYIDADNANDGVTVSVLVT